MQVANGQTVHARGRDWTVVCSADGVDLLIADPHLTDAEQEQIKRVTRVNEMKGAAIPTGINPQRSALDLSELDHQ